ncbi:MAG: isoprenylcysteine carboxylmethyltransferase family protein [Bradymonadales bacterium]|nr:isoprenylcysteine carboxylmethyltransferase family protein [Bradymonadales bacterium]
MVQETDSKVETERTSKRPVTKLVAVWIILPLFFLATGGTLDWWEAWVYCALLLVPMTWFAVWMARRDPSFFERRFKLKEKEQAQRRLQAWGSLSFLAGLILPGLDHRFNWSDPPLLAVLVAMAVVLASYLAILRVFIENHWAGRTVETFAEQRVISTGPYALVRHPMYVGVLALYLATPVALASWWALLPMLTIVPMFVIRIRNEEEVLVRELPGYQEYRQKVRWRLVPKVW